jgi:hypothetical protein
MKSIVFTYPGFQSMPKGLKQMLVVSESVFFTEARPAISRPSTIRSRVDDYLSRVQRESKSVFRAHFGVG